MTYPQPLPPPVPQKSKASTVVIVILAIALFLCLGCAGVSAYFVFWAKDKAQEMVDNYQSANPTQPAGVAGATHTVRYEVTGSGTARLVWAEVHVGQGNGEFSLPWSKEFTLTEPNFGSQVIAVPKDKSTVLDTCKIFIDGVQVRTAKFSSTTLTCSYTYVTK